MLTWTYAGPWRHRTSDFSLQSPRILRETQRTVDIRQCSIKETERGTVKAAVITSRDQSKAKTIRRHGAQSIHYTKTSDDISLCWLHILCVWAAVPVRLRFNFSTFAVRTKQRLVRRKHISNSLSLLLCLCVGRPHPLKLDHCEQHIGPHNRTLSTKTTDGTSNWHKILCKLGQESVLV